MATWRERLLSASFRGVPFGVERESTPVGRRTQVHEYPKRDEAYVEDMGLRLRQYSITGWVAGDDCFDRRDALQAALEQAGEGELVHPWYGRMIVTATDCTVSHDKREGGVVRFDMVFVFGRSKPATPTATTNTQKRVETARSAAWESALARYRKVMDAVNTARININAARNAVSRIEAVIAREFRPVADVIKGAQALVDTLINAPGNLSTLFVSYFDTLDGTTSSKGYAGGVAAIAASAIAAGELEGIAVAGGADTVAAVQAAADLVQAATFAAAAAEVALLEVTTPPAELEPGGLDQQILRPPERPEVPVADDVIAARNALRAAIWSAALRADHGHYPALVELRGQVDRHLTAVAASGVRLQQITPLDTVPALVLAYRQYGDATRGGEIVTRNRIAHPGFLPSRALQIASR
ncbi:hydroxyacid dehydrogenase [Azoarcus indigens]|uniref:Prophage DNA circulation protein n=1 Tax=Azoarcus indigens TaxID=29545 RepID=A0A4R6E0X5_9RHOO|nr:DNA circularization N-terminal domain-containing protein [Azoarcus indigens]NMG64880.1 hydroxyacid dehydrogenase [Azoarcus indigens]TDN50418.1 prophage DNA circulation protein [Azoarcus indigens]